MNGGYVYVIAFDNGTVKVGCTQKVANRLGAHKRDGRKFGIAIADSWVSPLHVEWEPNEDALKSITARHGGTPAWTGAEYFTGADYALVVDAATQLPFTSPDEGAECLSGPVSIDLRKLWMKRIRAGLNANALARLAGLDPSYVRLIERGKRGPSPRTLDALTRALGCDITDLMPDQVAA